MIKLLDSFLNSITQYRLMLYFLISLNAAATLLSFLKVLPFNVLNIIFSAVFITAVCSITNKVFSKVFKVPANLESLYITALILTLIFTPATSLGDLIIFAAAGVLSQSSKYLLAVNKKHIFNPATLAAVFSSVALNHGASWWVGTSLMMPFVLAGGFLIVRKIQRFDLVFNFFITYLVVILVSSVFKGNDLIPVLKNIILESPLLFFAFVMLTEPLTTPPAKKLQMIYGGMVGFLTAFFPPEMALLLGNIFSYVVSPKDRLLLELKEKIQIGADIYDFVFKSDKKIAYLPGQYMEWTLGYKNPDNRGNRRYFTLASSPTEDNLRIGVKFYPNSSSFKKSLIMQNSGSKIFAGQPAGEFTLPKDINRKLCFIAGGIGVTPYRSMIKYLLDINQKRDIVLVFSNKTQVDTVYKNIFDEAYRKLGIKTIYVFGHLEPEIITKEVPDYKERIFYISGPHSMVDAFKDTLISLGVAQIKVDFFPGYA